METQSTYNMRIERLYYKVAPPTDFPESTFFRICFCVEWYTVPQATSRLDPYYFLFFTDYSFMYLFYF